MPSSTCRKLRGRKSSEEYSVELAGSSHIRDASICAILLIRLNSGLVVFRFLSFYTSRSKADYGSDRFWREADIRQSGEVRKVPNGRLFDQHAVGAEFISMRLRKLRICFGCTGQVLDQSACMCWQRLLAAYTNDQFPHCPCIRESKRTECHGSPTAQSSHSAKRPVANC
jgi:hypothetical protein